MVKLLFLTFFVFFHVSLAFLSQVVIVWTWHNDHKDKDFVSYFRPLSRYMLNLSILVLCINCVSIAVLNFYFNIL